MKIDKDISGRVTYDWLIDDLLKDEDSNVKIPQAIAILKSMLESAYNEYNKTSQLFAKLDVL